MSGTELIMGMEEVVQHIRELENLKEALAQKFYKHYDEMDYNKLNIARTVGPDLGRMVEHLMEENKKLKEKNDDFEAMMIDAEAEDQGRDNTIASLEEENKRLKEENEELMLENHRYQDPTREEAKLLETMRKGFMGEIEELKKENKELKEELEKAKEVAYHMGVDIFSDDPDEI